MTRDKPWAGSTGWETANTTDLAMVSKCVTMFTWSPIVWNGGGRNEDNFLKAYFIALDFDKGMTCGQAVNNIFCDTSHIIGTTFSHQKVKGHEPPCDRFRVILRLAKPIENQVDWVHNTRALIQKHNADIGCQDAARPFWACTSIVSILEDADDYEWLPAPPAKPRELDPNAAFYRSKGVLPGWLIRKFDKVSTYQPGRNSHLNACLFEAMHWYLQSETQMREIVYNSRIFKENQNDREFVRGVEATFKSVLNALDRKRK